MSQAVITLLQMAECFPEASDEFIFSMVAKINRMGADEALGSIAKLFGFVFMNKETRNADKKLSDGRCGRG